MLFLQKHTVWVYLDFAVKWEKGRPLMTLTSYKVSQVYVARLICHIILNTLKCAVIFGRSFVEG